LFGTAHRQIGQIKREGAAFLKSDRKAVLEVDRAVGLDVGNEVLRL
jgi:hypothetical protein